MERLANGSFHPSQFIRKITRENAVALFFSAHLEKFVQNTLKTMQRNNPGKLEDKGIRLLFKPLSGPNLHFQQNFKKSWDMEMTFVIVS